MEKELKLEFLEIVPLKMFPSVQASTPIVNYFPQIHPEQVLSEKNIGNLYRDFLSFTFRKEIRVKQCQNSVGFLISKETQNVYFPFFSPRGKAMIAMTNALILPTPIKHPAQLLIAICMWLHRYKGMSGRGVRASSGPGFI